MGAVTFVFMSVLRVDVGTVAVLLDIFCQSARAALDNLALVHDVDAVGLNPAEDAVVVRDEKDGDAALSGFGYLSGDELQSVDVEARIYLVDDDAFRRKERELKYLHFFLFPARKAFVNRAREELVGHVQRLCRVFDILPEVRHFETFWLGEFARRNSEEIGHRDARDRLRMLEREQDSRTRYFIGLHLRERVFAEGNLALGDSDVRMRENGVAERGFAAAVGPHQDARRAPRHCE